MAQVNVTAAEVQAITAEAVGATTLLKAQNIVEMTAGRALDDTLKANDLSLLKKAVAFQATWLEAHPEALVQSDFQNFKQGDFSATPRDSDSNYLAPLARRAMKRCSWNKSRTVSVISPFERYGHEEAWESF